MSFSDCSVAADRIVLISNPHDENYVESRGGVVEEFRHYRLHTYGQNNYIRKIE